MDCKLMKIGLAFIVMLVTAEKGLSAQDGTGLKTNVAVDLVGDSNLGGNTEASDQFGPREVEVGLFAATDHLFDGLLSLAAHNEQGAYFVELHEAYISSDRLIPGSRFRLGQFFLGVGRLNRFHRHDWPFITAPIVQEKFFGPEGVLDSGFEYSYILPLPFYLDLTAGVSNGFTFGHSHDGGTKPRKPTHYARMAMFASAGDLDMQPGINFLGRQAADGQEISISGIDFTAKVKTSEVQKFLIQTEVWQRRLKPLGGDAEESVGLYVYPQYGFDSRVQVGVRYDYFTVSSLKDATGHSLANSERAYVPTITYKPSEFSTFRLAYSHNEDWKANAKTTARTMELQGTFILGAHPAHDF